MHLSLTCPFNLASVPGIAGSPGVTGPGLNSASCFANKVVLAYCPLVTYVGCFCSQIAGLSTRLYAPQSLKLLVKRIRALSRTVCSKGTSWGPPWLGTPSGPGAFEVNLAVWLLRASHCLAFLTVTHFMKLAGLLEPRICKPLGACT